MKQVYAGIDNQNRAKSFLLRKARIVATLTLREIRVTFGSAKLGYFWAIADSVLGTALLTLIFSFITRQPPLGQCFPLFFATGIIKIQYYQKISGSLMAVFEANKSLLVHPRINETEVTFGRFFIITATYLTIYSFFWTNTFLKRLLIQIVSIFSWLQYLKLRCSDSALVCRALYSAPSGRHGNVWNLLR